MQISQAAPLSFSFSAGPFPGCDAHLQIRREEKWAIVTRASLIKATRPPWRLVKKANQSKSDGARIFF